MASQNAFRPSTRSTLFATLYALTLGIAGIGFLIAVTAPQQLLANALPLTTFAVLSFMLKRAGFHVARDVTHSLVGIVDLAAVLIFGPVLGAWVAASSGFTYLFLNAWRRERHSVRNLFEIPLFNAGLKVGMAYAASHLYGFFGGAFPARSLGADTALAYLAAIVAWFGIDHIGWGLLEYLRGGTNALVAFLRMILVYSLMMELLPLPFAAVIAVVYSSLDRGIFVLLALGLFGTAILVQRFADASAHLLRRRNELAVLNAFGQALSRAGFDPDKIVDLLCLHARQIVPTDLCRVELFGGDSLPGGNTQVALEATADTVQRVNQPTPESPLYGYFLKAREPIRALDLITRSVFPPEAASVAFAAADNTPVDGAAPRSALFVPLSAGEELIGALSLFATLPDAFHPIHARNLASMGAQAAVAIQNARLYAAEQRRATQLAIVSEVSRQVAAVLDLDDLLQQVANGIRERFGYAKVHVFTVDSDAGYAVFRASTDPHGVEWREQNWRLRLGLEGIVGWVAAVGELMVVDDVSKEPRFILDPDETTTDTRSVAVVPLVVSKDIVGVLDVQSNQLNAFDADDVFILKTLAAQVAIAIEDTRLFNSQREEAWYLNVLLQVAENLTATSNLDEGLETVVRITPLLVGVTRCGVFLYDRATGTFSPAKAYGLSDEQESEFLKLSFGLGEESAFSRLARELAPVLIENASESPLVRQTIRDLFGTRSLLLVPLMTRGELVGAMIVDQGTRARLFTPHEIQVVMGIANQTAVTIEGARLSAEAEGKKRYEYELGLARQIQESFLPDACPRLPDYEICTTWQTAREVGGDFYDFIPLSGERLGTVIADVSDKGIAAALFMALARTIIRTMAIGKPTPHEALERANEVILADAHTDMFVTVFFAVLDPPSGRVVYANAGHNPPLRYCAATREVMEIKGHGTALGVIPDLALHDYAVDLEPGDILLLYTDGITEAFNSREEEFGDERLASLLATSGHLSASEVVDEITHAVSQFTGEHAQLDDLTLVAFKRSNTHHEPVI